MATPPTATPTVSHVVEPYEPAGIINFIVGLPRYGFGRDIRPALGGSGGGSYLKGVVISSCFLLVALLAWCIFLAYCKFFSSTWLCGYMYVIAESGQDEPDYDRARDDDESSCSGSSEGSETDSLLSFHSSDFWKDPKDEDELSMAAISKEQKRDRSLAKALRRKPDIFSTTTNGDLTLITMMQDERATDGRDVKFRVFIPSRLRLPLLRTYHDCLTSPTKESNPASMVYEYFTWDNIRLDVKNYIARYRECTESGETTMVMYESGADDDDKPITLDIIAEEQSSDKDLERMMVKAPSVFSTATNGNIKLITARGKDKKYRIVIPKALQPRVLTTYHNCLVNPTEENNFEKVLYVHFTWNGIHKDVEMYVRNNGLTEEMRSRQGFSHRGREDNTEQPTLRAQDSSSELLEEATGDVKPIGLDEIAREQKKDTELRQLKKEEPFVFSTVRYGNTLLTTAQNFRDNKYRIVIPRRLQQRMLETYRDCLLNPTPDRNFDTLLYNHFTWNGIHDDVDYFVKSGGFVKDKHTINSEVTSMRKRTELVGDPVQPRNSTFDRKLQRLRIVFLLSCVAVIICSILFFEQGSDMVTKVVDATRDVLVRVDHAVDSALLATDEYFDAQATAQETAADIGSFNSSYCPQTQYVMNSTYTTAVDMRDTSLRIEHELKGIKSDLQGAIDAISGVNSAVDDFNSYANLSKAMVVIVDMVVVYLMLSCILAWAGERNLIDKHIRTVYAVPLLLVVIIIFWISSSATLFVAIGGSDYCVAPDESTLAFTTRFQNQMSPLSMKLVGYFVTGCLSEREPPRLSTLSTALATVGYKIHTRLEVAETLQNSSIDQCNSLYLLLKSADKMVTSMFSRLSQVRLNLACRHFNHLYTLLFYEVICDNAVVGLSWMFFTLFAISFFGMIMITLRAAIQRYY